MALLTKQMLPFTELDTQGPTLSTPLRTHSLKDLDGSTTTRRCQPPRRMKSGMRSPKMMRTMSDTYATIETGSMMAPKRISRKTPHRQRSTFSVSEDSDEVLYTRTGRVSKALKGKRVHECEFCDKVILPRMHWRSRMLTVHLGFYSCRTSQVGPRGGQNTSNAIF